MCESSERTSQWCSAKYNTFEENWQNLPRGAEKHIAFIHLPKILLLFPSGKIIVMRSLYFFFLSQTQYKFIFKQYCNYFFLLLKIITLYWRGKNVSIVISVSGTYQALGGKRRPWQFLLESLSPWLAHSRYGRQPLPFSRTCSKHQSTLDTLVILNFSPVSNVTKPTWQFSIRRFHAGSRDWV